MRLPFTLACRCGRRWRLHRQRGERVADPVRKGRVKACCIRAVAGLRRVVDGSHPWQDVEAMLAHYHGATRRLARLRALRCRTRKRIPIHLTFSFLPEPDAHGQTTKPTRRVAPW